MKDKISLLVVAVVAAFACLGCEHYSEPEYEGPVVPDVAGNWKGTYYFYEYSDRTLVDLSKAGKRGVTPITATVVLNETNHTYITITTSRNGRGHHLVGRIDAAGNIRATDSYDGETWTSYRQRATPNTLELNDIAFEDELKEGVGRGLLTILLDEHIPDDEPENDFGTLFGN